MAMSIQQFQVALSAAVDFFTAKYNRLKQAVADVQPVVALGMKIPAIVLERIQPMDRVALMIASYPDDKGNPERLAEAGGVCVFLFGKLEAEQLRILRLSTTLDTLCKMLRQASYSDRSKLVAAVTQFRLLSETSDVTADALRTEYFSVRNEIETAAFVNAMQQFTQEFPVSSGNPISDLPTAGERIEAVMTPKPNKRRKPRTYVSKKENKRRDDELEPKEMKKGRSKGDKKVKVER